MVTPHGGRDQGGGVHTAVDFQSDQTRPDGQGGPTSVSQPANKQPVLTCLFVGLLIRPNDGAETGEDQRAQPAGSFLRAAVVVQRVLAQHEPVAPLLDPVPAHLQEEPACENKPTRTDLIRKFC